MKKIVMVLMLTVALCMGSVAPVSAATKEVPITGISWCPTEYLKVGEQTTVSISTYPSNTTYKTNIEWGYQTNSKFNVKVNGYGTYWGSPSTATLQGTSVGTGYMNITVKVYDSTGKYITKYNPKVTVNVAAAPTTAPKRPLQGITLNRSQATMSVGSTVDLSVSYTPSNTTDSKTVNWSSSDNNVVTVFEGKLIARNKGTATITAKVGSKVATCRVTVVAPGTGTTTKATTKPTTKPTTKATTKPTTKATTKKPAQANGNVSVGNAYTLLNKFRTSKSVWQWNSNNKTKKYFNTNSKNKLKALKRDPALEKTAQLRAKEIATKFSHTRPNGKSCFTAYPSYSRKGENIARGYKSAYYATEAWKETNCKYSGQGHRRAMLNKDFNVVGIGCYKKDNMLFWVQCFGKK